MLTKPSASQIAGSAPRRVNKSKEVTGSSYGTSRKPVFEDSTRTWLVSASCRYLGLTIFPCRIATTDTRMCWALPDGEQFTPVSTPCRCGFVIEPILGRSHCPIKLPIHGVGGLLLQNLIPVWKATYCPPLEARRSKPLPETRRFKPFSGTRRFNAFP